MMRDDMANRPSTDPAKIVISSSHEPEQLGLQNQTPQSGIGAGNSIIQTGGQHDKYQKAVCGD
jgi:hypothetical protein